MGTFAAAMKFVEHDHVTKYLEYAHNMAASAVKKILEETMASTPWLVSTPFAREHFGRGKEEGRAEGRVESEVEAIFTVLGTRGIEVSDDAGDRIRACTDQEQLVTWLRCAIAATSIGDLFD